LVALFAHINSRTAELTWRIFILTQFTQFVSSLNFQLNFYTNKSTLWRHKHKGFCKYLDLNAYLPQYFLDRKELRIIVLRKIRLIFFAQHTYHVTFRFFERTKETHTIITPTKCTLPLLKAPDITICTLCLILCSYMFQPAWVICRGLNDSAWLNLLLITIY
jgi:hypothetical protein